VVVLDFGKGEMKATANTPIVHPLMHVCKLSRKAYQECFPDPLTVGKGKKVLVNFAGDLFSLRCFETWRVLVLPSPLDQMQNIVVDDSALGNAYALYNALAHVATLQQFWVCLTNETEKFRPPAAERLRRHCGLHHCEEQPSRYVTPEAPDRSRQVCPVCLWHKDIFGLYQLPDYFQLVLDSTLPERPTKQQILDSKIPAIGWIRSLNPLGASSESKGI